MTFSQSLQKEVQPSDFLIKVAKRVTAFELNNAVRDLYPEVKQQLTNAVATHVVNFSTIRKEEHHSHEFSISVFVIPEDDFMGLVTDMAKALLTTISVDTEK